MKRRKWIRLAAALLCAAALTCTALTACRKADNASPDDVPAATQKVNTLLDVPYLSQEGWPTGCEAASAAMVLQFYGVDADIADVVNAMPKAPTTYENGQTFGPDPNEYFVGSPDSVRAFGCYAGVVETAMNQLLPQTHKAEAIRGQSMETLEDFIDNGQPVLLWATIEMQESYDGAEWILRGTNRTFTWIAPEHCLVLVGYDDNAYYFQDPYEGNGLVKWSKALVEMRYTEMGQQTVVVYEKEPS